jgi:hypothetical protein
MKVNPKNDDVRRVLYHPAAGHFRAQGAADWPDDAFTNRRLKDGDITKEEAPPQQRATVDKETSEEERHADAVVVTGGGRSKK